jgi:RNA polymerase sigma-70 factor (ECF subfamily)
MAQPLDTTTAAPKQTRHGEEQSLLRQVQQGNGEAFEVLFTRYRQRVCNHAMALLHNAMEAEDIMQDVFTALYHKSDAFRGEATVSTWLHRVTVNAALTRQRRIQRQHALRDRDMDGVGKQVAAGGGYEASQDMVQDLIKAESIRYLQAAIAELPPVDRAVVVLGNLQGQSDRATATALGLSIAAVKSRRHRVRLCLKEKLSVLMPELGSVC